MNIEHDEKNQPFVAWEQGPGGFKRAWIRRPDNPNTDWAGTGRYINVARTESLGSGPAGQSADFPIFNDLPDEQVLMAFVASVCGITGCQIP